MATRRDFLKMGGASLACSALASATPARGGREYHVAKSGNDSNDGSAAHPLKTISAAAALAMPGDVITVHEGVYRERVAPPRGGTSDARRIVYQAAAGERAEISGAELVSGWKLVQDGVWKVTLPNSFFGDFNPYSDVIHGDWFDARGRVHHTGAVYVDGEWLSEAAAQSDVLQKNSGPALWFGGVDGDSTTICAQFRHADPNRLLTEINVRRTVFYPEKTGIDYITVRGFVLRQAATPWAPPTAEQIGVIGTHWSKGWIIENNVVRHSTCSGIALGKYGDQWDNTSANTAEGYVKTIERAEKHGWTKERIGHHIVRNNTISHCEQTGIVGSLGPVFSVVTGNTIHDIHVRQLYSGAEIAGIKFHAAIDAEISHNRIFRSYRGMWLDWMAQGARVTANSFHDNQVEDLFVEVDHGPFVVDNNLLLSKTALHVNSQGGAFAHNLICGGVNLVRYDSRQTPYMKPHSTEVAGYHDNPDGDMRFLNNLVAGSGDLSPWNETRLPVRMEGNVFVQGARPCSQEAKPLLAAEFDPQIALGGDDAQPQIAITLDAEWARERQRKMARSQELGRAVISGLPFERSDGGPLAIDTDFAGRQRDRDNPFPGPFEFPQGGRRLVKL